MTALLSQNLWPASVNRADIGVRNYQVPGSNRYLSCAQAVAPILIAFAAEFHKKIEPIDLGTYDDWGYARPIVIPGSPFISNHGSGTALDLDATLHPWKKINTFSIIKRIQIRLLCRKYGIRWGGDYGPGCFKDEMHYEVTESPVMVRDRIKAMKLVMPKVMK